MGGKGKTQPRSWLSSPPRGGTRRGSRVRDDAQSVGVRADLRVHLEASTDHLPGQDWRPPSSNKFEPETF